MKKKCIIGSAVLATTGVAAMAGTAAGVCNVRAMKGAIDSGMTALEQSFEVIPVDAGEFDRFRVYGVMPFRVQRYQVKELGNLCVMTANAGLMQMSTFVISPFEKDAPLLSMDFIYVLGNRKAIVELYDLGLDSGSQQYQGILDRMLVMADSFGDLADEESTPAWYDDILPVCIHKAGSFTADARFALLFEEAVRTYAEAVAELPSLSDEDKDRKVQMVREYSNNLVEKGGLSTDVFKKSLGEEATRQFFDTVFFGFEQ